MNDIREDLEIVQLDKKEFLEHTLDILKRNWKNFLFSMIFLTVLNIFYFYKVDLADKIANSKAGEMLYNLSKKFNFSDFFDDGYQEFAKFGLYLRILKFIEMIISFFKEVLLSGLIISISYYIDKNKKENSFLRTLRSFFRIIAFLFLMGVFGIILGIIYFGITYLLPINKIILGIISIFMILYFFIKGRYIPIEFLYKKNNIFLSFKNSFFYSKNVDIEWLFACLILFFIKVVIIYLFILVGRFEILVTILRMICDIAFISIITLSYFNERYLKESEG